MQNINFKNAKKAGRNLVDGLFAICAKLDLHRIPGALRLYLRGWSYPASAAIGMPGCANLSPFSGTVGMRGSEPCEKRSDERLQGLARLESGSNGQDQDFGRCQSGRDGWRLNSMRINRMQSNSTQTTETTGRTAISCQRLVNVAVPSVGTGLS